MIENSLKPEIDSLYPEHFNETLYEKNRDLTNHSLNPEIR